MYDEFLNITLQGASKIALKNFGKVSSVIKGEDNNQVLTETDIEIGKYIIAKIIEEYPDYNIVDEEAGIINNNSNFTWVVDPIDGTSNFASGVITYGIMMGILKNHTPIAGGVILPELDQVFTAHQGKGAYCNGKSIRVSSEGSLLSSLVAYGIDGHQENPQLTSEESIIIGDLVLGIRSLRSSNSVFDLMMVAEGKYGAALNKTSKIWDNVAPHIIIEEAGGQYTDYFGNTIDYSKPLTRLEDNYTYCAANPSLHNQIQNIIHKRP